METLVSAGCLAALVAMLAVFDDRVRQQVAGWGAHSPAHDLAYGSAWIREFFSTVFYIARDQSQQHGPLMILVIASIVLFAFMLRS